MRRAATEGGGDGDIDVPVAGARLRDVRIALVEAVAAHDRQAASKAVREYTAQTLAIAEEAGASDGQHVDGDALQMQA